MADPFDVFDSWGNKIGEIMPPGDNWAGCLVSVILWIFFFAVFVAIFIVISPVLLLIQGIKLYRQNKKGLAITCWASAAVIAIFIAMAGSNMNTEVYRPPANPAPEKITIDSLTGNLPYGKSNTGEFHAIEKIYNVSFDDAWIAVNKVFLNGGYEVVTSDRNKGILVGQRQGFFFPGGAWTAAIIERITEYSVKITIKNLAYGKYGGQSFSNTIHKNLEKDLKSKIKHLK